VLHTARGLSALPGLSFPPGTPLFPNRTDFLTYLHRYAETFRVPVETDADVRCLRRENSGWTALTTSGRQVRARAVVIATGIASNPHVPEIPHRDRFTGTVLHSAEYCRVDGYAGRRILVVGAGNSAGEISVELARAGADVTIAVRSGASVVPRELGPIPIQYLAIAAATVLPKAGQRAITAMMGRIASIARGPAVLPPAVPTSCHDVPLIGFHLSDALRARAVHLKGGLREFTAQGVRFSDGSDEPFDTVMFATGYRAVLGMLHGMVRTDACGFGLRRDRVISVDQPALCFVGHNYDVRGALFNISRDARLAASYLKSLHFTQSRI